MPRTLSDTTKKEGRVYIRTTSAQKDALTRAARARRQPATAFVLQASMRAAEEVLAREERVTMSERDFARFVELIESPSPPTDNLRKLMANYDALRLARPEANWTLWTKRPASGI